MTLYLWHSVEMERAAQERGKQPSPGGAFGRCGALSWCGAFGRHSALSRCGALGRSGAFGCWCSAAASRSSSRIRTSISARAIFAR